MCIRDSDHPAHHDHDHGHGQPHGWRRWLFATNHKDIGTMYLLFSFAMLMIGGVLALGIRAELFQPGLQYVNPELFNQLTTMHGLIMVFGAIMPAFVGFANWMIPLQVGAADMAFARMNNLSFWLLIPAALMLAGSFFMPGGAPAAGWTLYAPLTLQMGPSMDAAIFAMHIMGASSIMGSINIVVTILNMRAPGMTLMKMPLFCWTWLITAYPVSYTHLDVYKRQLRTLGGNVDPRRYPGLRTPRWRDALLQRLQALARADGRVALEIELVYGHAFKLAPAPRMASQTSISLQQMRDLVRGNQRLP